MCVFQLQLQNKVCYFFTGKVGRFWSEQVNFVDRQLTNQPLSSFKQTLTIVLFSLTFFCHFQGLYLEITLREVVFNELLKLGREVLEKTAPGPNRETLQEDLNNLESRWTDVYYNTVERQEKLEEIVPLAQKYSESVSDLLPWLEETEQMVADCHVMIVCEKHSLTREETFIKVHLI